MKNVLFIAAHPDDVDLGCAISIHNHYLKNDKVIIVVLTHGEKGVNLLNRLEEQENSLNILSPNSEHIFLDFPDTKLYTCVNEIIIKIKSIADAYSPDIVYIPTKEDSHQDHVTAHNCALSVFNNMNISKIISYETPSTTPEFIPNYFTFCNENQFKVKLKALQCHKSQIDKPYFSNDIIYSRAKMRASQGKVYNGFLAEAYEIIRINEGL